MILPALGTLVAGAGAWLLSVAVTRAPWRVTHPRAALTLWAVLMDVVVLTVLGGSVAIAFSAADLATRDLPEGLARTIAGWAALFVLAGLVAAAGAKAEAITVATRAARSDMLALPRRSTTRAAEFTVITCRSDQAFACSIPGRVAAVVISDTLLVLLTPRQLDAVIAHERAHLHLHHDAILRATDIVSGCLPATRRTERMRREVHLLVELCADDAAARSIGAVHLANALLRVSRHQADQGMELRADRLALRRWRHPRQRPAADGTSAPSYAATARRAVSARPAEASGSRIHSGATTARIPTASTAAASAASSSAMSHVSSTPPALRAP